MRDKTLIVSVAMINIKAISESVPDVGNSNVRFTRQYVTLA